MFSSNTIRTVPFKTEVFIIPSQAPMHVRKTYRVSQKKYTCLMSHKKTTIALILKILFGFQSKNLKVDHDMKNNRF